MLVGTGGWHGFSNSSPKPGVLSQKGWVWRWDSLWVHKLSAGRRTDGPLQAHEWHQRPPPKPHWNRRIPTVCAQLLWARLAQTSRSFHLIPPSAQWPLPPTPNDYPECHRCPHMHPWWWWASQPQTRHLTPLDRLERDHGGHREVHSLRAWTAEHVPQQKVSLWRAEMGSYILPVSGTRLCTSAWQSLDKWHRVEDLHFQVFCSNFAAFQRVLSTFAVITLPRPNHL